MVTEPTRPVPRHRLGGSRLDVSIFALGSWRTYERISRADGLAVLARAREVGIDFLEIARYDDESGRAPIATGYSELVFGELLRRSGRPRDELTIAEKLWWEFWPRQSATAELDASLRQIGLDHVDLLYSDPPPEALPMEEVAAAVGELIADLEAPNAEAGKRAVGPLVALATDLRAPPASLAMAFALADPRVATVLFGATRLDQISENARASEVLKSLTEARLARLRGYGRAVGSGPNLSEGEK